MKIRMKRVNGCRDLGDAGGNCVHRSDRLRCGKAEHKIRTGRKVVRTEEGEGAQGEEEYRPRSRERADVGLAGSSFAEI